MMVLISIDMYMYVYMQIYIYKLCIAPRFIHTILGPLLIHKNAVTYILFKI